MAGNTEIFVQNLTYFHDPSGPPSLSGVNISLPKGSRTLLIGANGGVHFRLTTINISVYRHLFSLAGKSTLLQILAGKRLVSSEGARILIKGCDVFRNSPAGVTYLGTEWEVLLAKRSPRRTPT
jgi:CCR4-NOT complex subunit CAF16